MSGRRRLLVAAEAVVQDRGRLVGVGPAQREELLLTAAQSLFAVAILINLEISVREAAALAGLFLIQFAMAAIVPGATDLDD